MVGEAELLPKRPVLRLVLGSVNDGKDVEETLRLLRLVLNVVLGSVKDDRDMEVEVRVLLLPKRLVVVVGPAPYKLSR